MQPVSLPPINIPSILRQYGLHPRKGLGQNFLQDERALQKIVTSAGMEKDDTVLEIGPGLGNLTRYLALSAGSVVAVELDANLFPALEAILAPYGNVRLVHGDILKIDPVDLVDRQEYLVVANIPYYITSAVIRHLLEGRIRPRRLVLTVQTEVAERICAGPGKMNLLALSVQVYGKPSMAAKIPASAFHPRPKVDSTVVRVDVYEKPVIPAFLLPRFFQLAKAGFGQRRKTIRNALGSLVPRERLDALLARANIDPQRRAETLTLDEWGNLTEADQG
jgi:16S rRNA (adenine1518-N6/adenine1519-N6)-dimethyltransferase